LLRLVLVSYRRGAYALAITHFSEYLQQHPDSATAHLNPGRCHLRQRSIRDARDCFRKAGGVGSDEQRWLAHIVKGDERREVGVRECTPSGDNPALGSRHATEYRPILTLDKTLRWYSHV
jgi:hypothetical protein